MTSPGLDRQDHFEANEQVPTSRRTRQSVGFKQRDGPRMSREIQVPVFDSGWAESEATGMQNDSRPGLLRGFEINSLDVDCIASHPAVSMPDRPFVTWMSPDRAAMALQRTDE